jgi:Excalibur calcium-binding domain
MFKISSLPALVALVAGFFVVTTSVNAQQTYKCKVNGTVTYQQDPCPAVQFRKPPSVLELNASEKKRREAVAIATPEKAAIVQEKSVITPEKPVSAPANSPAASTPSSSFSCDGRKYCSQMKSCAEAKYFLANCPGVKMDGDKDGTPCEKQWCSR